MEFNLFFYICILLVTVLEIRVAGAIFNGHDLVEINRSPSELSEPDYIFSMIILRDSLPQDGKIDQWAHIQTRCAAPAII